jgi:hypothetical protein
MAAANLTSATTRNTTLARRTSFAIVAFALVNIAVIPLLIGCDGSNDALSNANAAERAQRSDAKAEQPPEVYLPRRHAIDPNAVEGNVKTYERD